MKEQEYIIDNQGKKRKATRVICETCGKSFLKPSRFIKRHAQNYCSKECAFKSRENRITVKCANCSKGDCEGLTFISHLEMYVAHSI